MKSGTNAIQASSVRQWGCGPATGNGSTRSIPLSAASTHPSFDPARIVCSLSFMPAATTCLCCILCIQVDRQYTLEMQILLNLLNHALVAMFLIGGVGSALVIVISFAEDMHELFTKDE